jgi:nitrogen regulatory protein PII-like uncharacterized protein
MLLAGNIQLARLAVLISGVVRIEKVTRQVEQINTKVHTTRLPINDIPQIPGRKEG